MEANCSEKTFIVAKVEHVSQMMSSKLHRRGIGLARRYSLLKHLSHLLASPVVLFIIGYGDYVGLG